jgi:hypothetical protein
MTLRRSPSPRTTSSASAALALAALLLVPAPSLGAERAGARGGFRLRGVGDTPRAAKEEALARLEEIRLGLADGTLAADDRVHAVEEIEDALERLERSLAPRFWARDDQGGIDGQRLDPERGHHVFHLERHAAQEIFDAIRHGGVAVELEIELLAIVDALVAADRSLSALALEEAGAAGGAAEELEEAAEHFAEGDELVAEAADRESLARKAALLYEAVDEAYRHAWSESIASLADAAP